jgi:hypothetical protein
MTPEGEVKAAVKKALAELGCWWYMPVPGGYGEPSLDFLCAFEGRMFAIETKAPGKKLTPRQRATIRKMEKHNIKCIMWDSTDTIELQAWILQISE